MFDFDTVIDRQDTGSEKWERYAGRDVLPMWVADMDFRSSPAILEALRRRVDHGVFGYTVPTAPARAAIVEHLARAYGWAIEPEWICFTPGVNRAMNLLCRVLAEPGDAALVPSPVYPPFFAAATHSGLRALAAPLARRDRERWELDLDLLARLVAEEPRAKLLLLCNPHNPVGRSWTRAELLALGEFCLRHQLWVVADEIHAGLELDDHRLSAFATLSPEIAARAIAIHSPSKTYNLPGLGCAFSIIPDEALRRRYRAAGRGLVPPDLCAFAYDATVAAYRESEPWRLALVRYLAANRDHLAATLAARCPRVRLAPCEATYLAWIDVSTLGLENPHAHFEAHGLGLSDGRDFRGPGFVRLNFGCPRATLEEGLRRLIAAVDAAK